MHIEKITQMLDILPEPTTTIVAVAAFTGVRKVNCGVYTGRITTVSR